MDFTGQRLDGTGLHFYNARYYASGLGRFVQADTLVPEPGSSEAYNRYIYVYNSPVRLTDPGGHDPCGGPGRYVPDCGVDNSPQYDLTAWLAEEMSRNAQTDGIKWIRWEMNSQGVEFVENILRALAEFEQLEGGKRIWDIKQEIQAQLGDGIVLCGEACDWYDYSTPGNIHFGYVAAAASIPQAVSAIAGGYLETKDNMNNGIPITWGYLWDHLPSLMDDPGDKAAVDFGYYLYSKYPTGISPEEFKQELTVAVTSQFQRPITPNWIAPGPALPQANTYGPGHFNYRPQR